MSIPKPTVDCRTVSNIPLSFTHHTSQLWALSFQLQDVYHLPVTLQGPDPPGIKTTFISYHQIINPQIYSPYTCDQWRHMDPTHNHNNTPPHSAEPAPTRYDRREFQLSSSVAPAAAGVGGVGVRLAAVAGGVALVVASLGHGEAPLHVRGPERQAMRAHAACRQLGCGEERKGKESPIGYRPAIGPMDPIRPKLAISKWTLK